jgi:CheY-like chemotaxis protein
VGFGATFKVRFPILAGGKQTPSNPEEENRRTLNGFRVLIVDDERDTGDLFKFVLEEAGSDVVVASSVEEALELLSSKRVDLILADIGLPRVDGFAFISAIRAHQSQDVREVRAIAVTSYAGNQIRTKALASGFDDYVTKPVQPVDLVKLVSNHLTEVQ